MGIKETLISIKEKKEKKVVHTREKPNKLINKKSAHREQEGGGTRRKKNFVRMREK